MCLVHACILSRTRADSAGSLVLLAVLAGQHAGVDVVDRVAELLDGQSRHRVLVAVDASDAAGKTTFADRLASAVEAPTVRVSVDSFLRPRHLRYQRGELSPLGYYLDGFDHDAPLEGCLRPFRAGDRPFLLWLESSKPRDAPQ